MVILVVKTHQPEFGFLSVCSVSKAQETRTEPKTRLDVFEHKKDDFPFQFEGDRLTGTQYRPPVDPRVRDPLRCQEIITVEQGPDGSTDVLCLRGHKGKHHCLVEQVCLSEHLFVPREAAPRRNFESCTL